MGVNAELMRVLTHRYIEYRQALEPPRDTTKAMALAAGVLEAVHHLVTGTGSSPGQERSRGTGSGGFSHEPANQRSKGSR
ncbi:hypothetical protein J2Y41_003912 [Arthrobacter sp. 1088]|nr:hypothetical protein [Arthrobacter sp. 1088]